MFDVALVLSIPPWFDCGYDSWRLFDESYRLSIPPWFDCGFNARDWKARAEELSIPPWFDCGWMAYVAGRWQRDAAFNPTLVRLRRGGGVACSGGLCPFQSHLGSIAAALNAPPVRPAFDFQSHLGSIAAGPMAPDMTTFIEAFNPTLVRLRLTGAAPPSRLTTAFNPTLVRLRPARSTALAAATHQLSIPPWFDCGREWLHVSPRQIASFNPTLVRLRRA